jgi:triacylglycerol lipase
MGAESEDEFEPSARPVTGPIEQLNLLEQSLLFAELSKVSYMDHDDARHFTDYYGFDEVVFIERDGAQAYLFGNEVDRVIACRGTEPNEWNDVKADARATTALAETVGRVHRGFKREVDDLWPQLDDFLMEDSPHIVWFTGHSLGGAMATICAGRCFLSDIPAMPKALFTYGSPRVGNKRYINYVTLEHHRWVNNNDIVARTPPTWMRYRHTGKLLYLDSNGHIRHLTPQQRAKDRWRGAWKGLKQRRIDHFTDHSIGEYIRHLAAEARTRPVS